MTEPIFNEMADVIIDKGVVGHFALPAVLHEPEIPQEAELMGDRRLAASNDGSEIADAEFLLRQRKEQLSPGRVRQNLEHAGEILESFLGADATQHLADFLPVHMEDVTIALVPLRSRPCFQTSNHSLLALVPYMRMSVLQNPADRCGNDGASATMPAQWRA